MRYDFHSHTHFSDGVLSPELLVRRAIERDLDLLAISDHDSVSGIEKALAAIQSHESKLRLVPSIEISAQTDFGEIHIVGLNIDIKDDRLLKLIEEQQRRRWRRAEAFEEQFIKLGVNGVLCYLKEHVVEVVTRTHVARALVELGKVKDNQQAFKKYLGKKGRVKAQVEWMPMPLAIETIHQAGGVAVLAHPTRYPMSNRRLSYLIEEFGLAGGDALELGYPSLSPDKQIWLDGMRQKNDLLASAGSDFHYPDLKWSDLGFFPQIKAGTPHVLERIGY
jgi:predicted metal-dependent phosphoesterase TrpH